MSQRVGIVGMGLMGQAFIKNMHETGFEVQGFDVDSLAWMICAKKAAIPPRRPLKPPEA